jgi:putative ABC transport system permease protein
LIHLPEKERFLSNLQIAYQAILANKIRALLTALGIIFGVAAVISMLAIGSGARAEILAQMELIGVNNIIVEAVFDREGEIDSDEDKQKDAGKFSPGLRLQDVAAIQKTIPNIRHLSPEVIINSTALAAGRSFATRLVGVDPDFFEMMNHSFRDGRSFTKVHSEQKSAVCVIGSTARHKLFPGANPIGQYVKIQDVWLRVVGVLADKTVTANAQENLGLRDFNTDIYIPAQTMLLRFRNRALRTSGFASGDMEDGDVFVNENNQDDQNTPAFNYHQIDRLTIQVTESKYLKSVAQLIQDQLIRRHNNIEDFHISIPQELLKQQQRTRDIFNLVLSVIAGISLLVGGIGIMNIMLASVLERTREIGTRLAIGARKSDVIWQFLLEAVFISLGGGIIGIALGVFGAWIITYIADIQTIISASAILISFGVAFTVGLIFGISPARRAAMQNPVESLRYE